MTDLPYTIFRRPLYFMPLSEGSPFDAAALGFLLMLLRGAILLAQIEAYHRGYVTLEEEAKLGPLLCHLDTSRGKINVSPKSHILSYTFYSFLNVCFFFALG